MVAGFWTLDRTTITGRSAVILRQHTTPFRPMIVPFDDLELVYQSLRTLEPPHTHKFPRVNAQDCKLGPIQPWDVKDFLRPGRGRDFGVVGRVAAVVGHVSMHQSPQALDRIKVRAVTRNVMNPDPAPRPCQPFLNEQGMVVLGIVDEDVNEPLRGIHGAARWLE
jgi:hypothetical protein